MQRMRCRLSLTQSTKYCFMLSHVSSCPGRDWWMSEEGNKTSNGSLMDQSAGGICCCFCLIEYERDLIEQPTPVNAFIFVF